MFKMCLFCHYNKPCALNCQCAREEWWRKPTITKKSLHHFLHGSDTMLHHYNVCMYCLHRLSMFRLFRHASTYRILTCVIRKIQLPTLYHLHIFIICQWQNPPQGVGPCRPPERMTERIINKSLFFRRLILQGQHPDEQQKYNY